MNWRGRELSITSKTVSRAALSLVLLAALVACGGRESETIASAPTTSDTGSPTDDNTPAQDGTAAPTELIAMSVAAPPIDSCSALFTAKAQGFFEEEGLDVEIPSLPSGAAIASGVIGGSLDSGCSSVAGIGAAVSKGIPLRIIAPGAIYLADAPTSKLVVASDSEIESAADLHGKTVAVNGLGSIAHHAPLAWVDANGGDSEQLEFVEMPHPEMAAALDGGSIDAALLVEPSLTRAVDSEKVRVLSNAFDAVADEFQLTVFFATEDWIQENPEAKAAFQRAMTRARTFSNDNPEETAAILADHSKAPPEVLSSMERARWPEDLDLALLQPPLDAAIRYGDLPDDMSGDQLVAE